MAKKKNLTVHELSGLKNEAFALGRKAVRGFEVPTLKKFYADNHLDNVLHDGHVMEVLVAFMLGMIQRALGKSLEVEMTEVDDNNKVDFRINGFPLQQKFDWTDKEEIHKLRDYLWSHGRILLINIKHHKNGSEYSIIESLEDMIRFAELPEDKIKGLSKCPVLKVSEKIWIWYCDHIKLRDVGLLS